MATLTIADLDNGKRDLETVDAVANSPEDTTVTRYGDNVLTLAGALRRLGYSAPVPYASGLLIDSGLTTVDHEGVIYAPKPTLVPFTTGPWDPEQWRPIQNLRNQHAILEYDSYASAEADASILPDNQIIFAPSISDPSVKRRYVVLAGLLTGATYVFGADSIGTKTAGIDRTVQSKVQDYVTVRDFGGTWDGVANVSAVAQAALNSGAKTVDFLSLPGKIMTSLTVPTGVSAINLNLTAGTAGMNMVLVSSGCRVTGVLTGTGTVSQVERGIYPVADSVEGVQLDVTVQNLTFGVQAQPIGATSYASMPKRWTGKVRANNIVGTVGASEGYALLLSPAAFCRIDVQATTIQRHAVYLSAGAIHNTVNANIDGCQNVAVQIYSSGTQLPSEFNTVNAKIRNVSVASGQAAGQAVGVYILGNAHRNTISIDMDGASTAEAAIVCEGVPTDTLQMPSGNIFHGHLKNRFLGADVVKDLGAARNEYSGLVIDGFATFSAVAFRMNGVRGAQAPWGGPRARGCQINAQGQAIIGFYTEVTDVVHEIHGNDVRNNAGAERVRNNSGGKRQGYSRRITFSGTTGSIGAGATGDATLTLSDPIAVSGRQVSARITNGSLSVLTNNNVTLATVGSSETSQLIRFFNGAAGAQTFDYAGFIEGD
jgi:hypothetical protein